MPLPIVTDGIYCAYRFVLNTAQSAEWTFALLSTESDMITLGDDLQSYWGDTIAPNIHESCVLSSVAMTPLDGSAATTVVPTEVAGGYSAGVASVDSLAMVVTFRTPLAGRSHRGRAYIPAVPNDALANRYQWSTANAGAMNDAFNDWRVAMFSRSISCVHGVLSRALSSITPVTAYQARTAIATQRRRLTGGVIF